MKILDVGQCGFDGPRMKKWLNSRLKATVIHADSADEAQEQLAAESFDLVLVNRILASDGSPGLELIGNILKSGAKVPVMLVSDLSGAQDAAVKLGAIRGFGKAALDSPATLELIERAVKQK